VGTINSNGLLERFEAHLAGSALAPATVTNYLADLRAFLRWNASANGAECSPLSCDVQGIRTYCLYLQQAKSNAASTVNRRLQALRKFFDFAVAQGWAGANPADDVPLLVDVSPQRPQHRTGSDVERVLTVMRGCSQGWSPRDRAIIEAMLGAGLKLGELIELRETDVHLWARPPYLSIGGLNGDGPGRIVPLDAEAHQALLAYLPLRQPAGDVDRFFVNQDGRPLSTRSVQRLLHDCAVATGLDSLTAQDLRYIYARTVLQRHGDVKEVARLLGHRHLATTIRYLRPDSEDVE
jgi:site-specific recombinase XerD